MYREVNAHFDSTASWFTKNGKKFFYEDGLGPYEYLMGALSGCFCSTLCDILKERGISVISIDVHTYGEKRAQIPSTLKDTFLDLRIRAERLEDEDAIRQCVLKTQEDCSMYNTIRCVSQMHVSIEVTA